MKGCMVRINALPPKRSIPVRFSFLALEPVSAKVEPLLDSIKP